MRAPEDEMPDKTKTTQDGTDAEDNETADNPKDATQEQEGAMAASEYFTSKTTKP